MPIQLNDDTIEISSLGGSIMHTIDKSYDDSNVISLLSTRNITFLEGVGLLNVSGDINYTGTLTKDGVEFSSYNDTDVISLLSTNNITLSNDGNVGIGNTSPNTIIDVIGNINISKGSRYQVNGENLSFNEINGFLTLGKGGTGTTNIDDLKTLLGIGTSSSEYEITDISPVFFNLTTTGNNQGIVNINDVDYIKPTTFTIYGKNFDRNAVIKLCLYNVNNNLLKEININTIYYDISIQLRVITKYIPISDIIDVSYFKLMMYNKNYPEKKILSRDIYKDEHEPTWEYTDRQDIYNIDTGYKFTINDNDTLNILLYEYKLTDGTHLVPNLSFNNETGEITGVPEILNTIMNLSINAKSGSKSLPTNNYTLNILSKPTIDTGNQELLVYNYFDLSATSDAESISDTADTSITWSLLDNDNTGHISLSGNRIIVSSLNLLGIDGTDITIEATDAYGYSITKTINVKKTNLNDPTINTGDQELLVYNYFDLSATSDAESIIGADTTIYWSLIGGYSGISLTGNRIIVSSLNLLGIDGTYITVKATDAYGYSTNKTFNVKKTNLNDPTINTGDQELFVYNYFDLSATSDAETKSIIGADTSITWSLIQNEDLDNITITDNKINVDDLNSLGIDGKIITVEATDAYGYSITKTINVKKKILNDPTINTGDSVLSSNTINLSATSDAAYINGADTTIYWSLIGVYSGISLSGNTIYVENINALPATGTYITVKATDAYGYSTNKTFNIRATNLYEFSSHTFTACTSYGRTGPTLEDCKSAYSSASWTQFSTNFNMSIQGVQLWTVPKKWKL